MIDDQELDLTVFTSRCEASWKSPGNTAKPEPEHLSARVVCVHVCVFVRVWQGGLATIR